MSKPLPIALVLALAASVTVACSSSTDSPSPSARLRPRRVKPNVVLVVLDDVGFGQLSPYGGPIPTPNIARVAERGLLYTGFHAAGASSASRAALLTGRFAGHGPERADVTPIGDPTLAETLRALGYSTYALGKWHNTPAEHVTPQGPFELWPQALGFEHFYGFFGAEADQWAPALWHDRWPFDPAAGHPEYLLTRDLFDHAIRFIREKDATGEPFFLYLAPGTTHAPHHAPRELVERNRGRFDEGWDRVREETLARQKQLRIVPPSTELPPRPDAVRAWAGLRDDEKRLFARMQEVHAAAVELADRELGRLLDELDDTGMRENTIIAVTSDEGASAEGGLLGTANTVRLANGLPERLDVDALDDLGGPRAFNHYPAGWAFADNTPDRAFGGAAHEGGVHVPFVVSWPKGIAARGELRAQFVHVADVAPTLVELARGGSPDDGSPRSLLDGASFAATLASAEAPSPRSVQIFETSGGSAIWADGWKAVRPDERWPWSVNDAATPADRWELYELGADPNETRDLASAEQTKLTALRALLARVTPQEAPLAARLGASSGRSTGRATVYEGVTRAIPEALAAPILDRSYTITAHVRAPQDVVLDGVIATCGGRFGGYALYVDHGKLTYVHNFVGDARYVIAARDPIYPGERELRFTFEKTGENAGHGRLFIDGVLTAEGEVAHTVPRAFPANEPCDTGMDTATPAGDYAVPAALTGRLHDVAITIDDERSSRE